MGGRAREKQQPQPESSILRWLAPGVPGSSRFQHRRHVLPPCQGRDWGAGVVSHLLKVTQLT